VGGGAGGSVGGGGGGVLVAVGSGGAVGSAGGSSSSGGGRGVLVGGGGRGGLVGVGIIEMGCSTATVGVKVGSGVRVGCRLTSSPDPNLGNDEQARLRSSSIRIKGKNLFNECRCDSTVITS
jgi:hypothetical protein